MFRGHILPPSSWWSSEPSNKLAQSKGEGKLNLPFALADSLTCSSTLKNEAVSLVETNGCLEGTQEAMLAYAHVSASPKVLAAVIFSRDIQEGYLPWLDGNSYGRRR
jgi:hypothetical protein